MAQHEDPLYFIFRSCYW